MTRANQYRYTSGSSRGETLLHKTGFVVLECIRLVLAAVFIFSGFVKAIDPLGYTYKIEDYLNAFGGFFTELAFLAFPVAVLFSTFELAIGLCFLFKVKMKLTSLLTMLFMAVMLPLTLYIAIKNPVTDCGCFGDALIISNWQTFYKNIVISAFAVLVFVFNKRFRSLFLLKIEWLLVLVFILLGIGLSVFSYRHLPMLDFRPYKVGVNIPEAMQLPEGAQHDKFETTLIYEKGGVKQEFTLENYPKNDSTWAFVEQKTTLVEKGYEPPIHNFVIIDSSQNDITDQLLHHNGKVHLLIMYDVNKTSEKGVVKAEELYQKARADGEPFYALTASLDDDISALAEKTGTTFPFCKVDPITLKTIIRANPGLMTIENGTIIKKRNWRDF